MTCEQFIQQNVNTARGGYRPEEVQTLIREAWRTSAEEAGQRLVQLVQQTVASFAR